jgi:molybdopterin converting factor small subunit
MIINLRLFALSRDLVGQSFVTIQLEHAASVHDLRNVLVATYPALKPLQLQLLFASGRRYLDHEDVLEEGMELACFPPVSGG